MSIDGAGEYGFLVHLMADVSPEQRPAFRLLDLEPSARVGAVASTLVRVLLLVRHVGRGERVLLQTRACVVLSQCSPTLTLLCSRESRDGRSVLGQEKLRATQLELEVMLPRGACLKRKRVGCLNKVSAKS